LDSRQQTSLGAIPYPLAEDAFVAPEASAAVDVAADECMGLILAVIAFYPTVGLVSESGTYLAVLIV
jgi:hypothetical protein